MQANKTRENDQSVMEFIMNSCDGQKQSDSLALLTVFENASGFPPKMWGDSIIGFGQYHYRYDSGREGDFLLVGFSPRKNAISLYFSCDIVNQEGDLLKKLGKYKTGKACVYINKLAEVDQVVLHELIQKAITHTKNLYPA